MGAGEKSQREATGMTRIGHAAAMGPDKTGDAGRRWVPEGRGDARAAGRGTGGPVAVGLCGRIPRVREATVSADAGACTIGAERP